MHKLIFIVLLFVVNFHFPTKASDITVTVYGSVTARPCLPASDSYTLDFGNISVEEILPSSGGLDWTYFHLKLNQCPVGTSAVSASFSGQTDISNSYFFKNNGSASGVALELRNINGELIKNGSISKIIVDSKTREAQFSLKVRPISVSENVSVGTIYTNLTVTYKYE